MRGAPFSRQRQPPMHRDIKEMLIGSCAIILFGIALTVWPPLGAFIQVLVTGARFLFERIFL